MEGVTWANWGGALDLEKPGISKVSTVKASARVWATWSKLAQSPSPDGTSTSGGPLPRTSQYQSISAAVCVNVLTVTALSSRFFRGVCDSWDTALCHGTSSRAFLTPSGLRKSCSLRGCVDSALCSPPLGSTSGQSVKEWGFDTPLRQQSVCTVLAACADWLQG